MQKHSKLFTLSLTAIATSLLLASTSGLAASYKGEANYKAEAMPAPCPQGMMLRDGFYVGLQGGYDSYKARVSRTLAVGAAGTATTFVGNPTINATGFVGGLFAGYGQYFSNMYYLGAELFVNDSSASQTQTSSSTTVGIGSSTYNKVSANASYGVSLLPGVKFNDSTLGYVRLGYNRADLQGQEVLTPEVGAPATVSSSGRNWHWQGGFNYGVGLETAVYQNFSVRSEFNHTTFGSFRTPAGTKFKVSDNQFMVGLNFHFA